MINSNVLDFYINRRLNLIEIHSKGEVELDYGDILSFDPGLADALQSDPDGFLQLLRSRLYERFINLNLEAKDIDIKLTGITPHVMIKDIGSKHERKAISFYGLVVRRSEIEPVVEMNKYHCMSCNREFIVSSQGKSTSKCVFCNSKKIELVDSIKRDVQYLDVQELIERTEPGVPAPKVKCILTGSFINTLLPGEIVELTGILRLVQSQNKRSTNLSKLIEIRGIKKMQIDFNSITLTDRDKDEIMRFSKRPDALERFANLVFPDIYGYDNIKKAIILQLVGANKKRTKAGTRLRSNIHILLIGDPGIAKSRMLQQVSRISPKAIYVSGKSASGVGLTATVEKDDYVGWTLKAGAVVLASGGIVAIDEFDKLDDDEKSALHEVMESGTVSIAKAGIVATLIADTTILAAANPKYGRFSIRKRIIDQFNIPPSLLSRFDLIFPIIDDVDVAKDERLAEAILNLHRNVGSTEYDPSFLRKYISYARKLNPKLTEEASTAIKNYYVEMRKTGASSGNVAITPRYLEGLVRLAEAHAKFRLSDAVELEDANQAISLMKEMINSVLKDPETGEVSVDILSTGMTSSRKSKMDAVLGIIQELVGREGHASKKKIREMAKEMNIEERELEEIIRNLINNGDIYESRGGEDGSYSLTNI
ncbi:MAG: minichromosome maintenance protein MCM [Candidatus Anstonellales archaeon]